MTPRAVERRGERSREVAGSGFCHGRDNKKLIFFLPAKRQTDAADPDNAGKISRSMMNDDDDMTVIGRCGPVKEW